MKSRRQQADEYYNAIGQDVAAGDARLVQRRALAGMLWTKQFYHIDMRVWLKGDPAQLPSPSSRLSGRNYEWPHLYNEQINGLIPIFAVEALECVCPRSIIFPRLTRQADASGTHSGKRRT